MEWILSLNFPDAFHYPPENCLAAAKTIYKQKSELHMVGF
jgi:hypothetical protein